MFCRQCGKESDNAAPAEKHYTGKHGGGIFLSLLLLICFSAGALFFSYHSYQTYIEWNAPYRDRELAALEDILGIIDKSGGDRLIQYRKRQETNLAETNDIKAVLAGLEARQSREILEAVYGNEKFDLDTFFNNSFFSQAYQEYLQDLIAAFKDDTSSDSWLYSYYATVKEFGGNSFLDTDMWIYSGSGDGKFSPDLDTVSDLAKTQYDLDFYEHMLYTGRIYITAADFMKVVLSLPRYIVDSAVFAKAYGGAPDTPEMSVPGWGMGQYEEFWLYGADYYNVDTPIWLDYGLSAEDFNLDWNSLLNEAPYYDAYKKFMEKVAPGLPYYDMSVYYADDKAYGGMGFTLTGTEATVHDIVASYAENHPEFTKKLRESGLFNESLSTSVDGEITETKARLEELAREYQNLEEQINALEQLLADADIYRSNYAFLLSDIERHTKGLAYRLLFFCGATLLFAIASIICLCKFFSYLKYPGHPSTISGQDTDFAFDARRCPMEELTKQQDRPPGQGNQKEE